MSNWVHRQAANEVDGRNCQLDSTHNVWIIRRALGEGFEYGSTEA